MGYKLVVLNEAKVNIVDSFNWYEDKLIGLGADFIYEVENILTYIQQYPEHFQKKYRGRYRVFIFQQVKDLPF